MPANILCVDDELIWRNVYKNVFRLDLGANLDLAQDSNVAMDFVKQNKYDLVIIDGLEGKCFKLYDEIVQVSSIKPIIVSNDLSVQKAAEEKGLEFYSKSNFSNTADLLIEKYNLDKA